MSLDPTRRRFLSLTTAGAAMTLTSCAHAAMPTSTSRSATNRAVSRRKLGSTGIDISILGIGGFHLGSVKDPDDATRIVHEAIDHGVNFFDNAWEYHDGKSEEALGRALAGGFREKAFVMTKVCTHGRNADVAMTQLEDSLRRLRTDHIDLWQVHECVYYDDPERHFAQGGVIEAITKAKQQGKVRYVGFTGHKDPEIHLAMLAHDYPFDTCQMPLNCFDGSYKSFEQRVLPEANRRKIAVLGMKSLTGEGDPVRKGVVTAEEAIRYAMSLPVLTTITGVDSLDILRQNLAIASDFVPMSATEMSALRSRVAEQASDGHLELYKSTVHYDAKVGREQHGFPSPDELPL